VTAPDISACSARFAFQILRFFDSEGAPSRNFNGRKLRYQVTGAQAGCLRCLRYLSHEPCSASAIMPRDGLADFAAQAGARGYG